MPESHTHSIALRDIYAIAYALGDADDSTTRSYPLHHAHHSTTNLHAHRVSITVGVSDPEPGSDMDADLDADLSADAAYRAEQSDGSTV